METSLDATLQVADKLRYDAACKRALSEKIILAWIMKRCLKEYAGCDVKDIAEKYIEGEPQVGKIPVMPDQPHTIHGMNTEDTTITEGTIYYDIRFYATIPGSKDRMGLIINVEAQNDPKPGYSLLKRAIYYCARMISAQKGSLFEGSAYDKIRKVYSIWVCMEPPKDRRNSITRYSITEENLIGHVKESVKNYDLMSVVNICLGDFEAEGIDETLRMLDSLFTEELTPQQKREKLEKEFSIPMSSKLESEVMVMGNLGEGIYNKGIERGRTEGIQIGIERGIVRGIERNKLDSIRSVIRKTGWTAKEAMNFLDIPKAEHEKYLDLLDQ